MTGGAATRAIVAHRLTRQAGLVLVAALIFALFALLRDRAPALEEAEASMLFGGLIAIAFALSQRGDGRMRELELCELSAPLYGRELARATALVPCIEASCALGLFWFGEALTGNISATAMAVSFFSVNAVVLVALCASVRHGAARLLYLGLAGSVIAAALALLSYSEAGTIAFCVLAGFIALRQYGEALARYDPI